MNKILQNPPGPKRRLFSGNLRQFYENQLEFLSVCAREFGDIVSLRFLHVPVFLLNHPDDIEYVMATNNSNFIKPKSVRMPLQKVIFGKGILSNEGKEWLAHRRLIQQAFQRDYLMRYAENIIEFTEQLITNWQEGETLEIYQELKSLTLKVAAKSFFGDEMLAQSNQLFVLLTSLVKQLEVEGKAHRIFHNFLPTKHNRNFRRTVAELDKIICQRIQHERTKVEISDNLLSKLVHACDTDGTQLTDKQIRDEAMTLLMASYDTTAIVLCWTFYLLTQNSDIEEKLISEFNSVFPQRTPKATDVGELHFAEKVIIESMRLYPPNRSVGRETVKDCEIRGYSIPAKSQILMSQWVVHRDNRFFNAPNDFQPERWNLDFSNKLHKYAYFPFGGGQRVCIGKSFAMIETKLILAAILSKFKFSLVAEQVIKPHPVILLRPQYGIKVKVNRRSLVKNVISLNNSFQKPSV